MRVGRNLAAAPGSQSVASDGDDQQRNSPRQQAPHFRGATVVYVPWPSSSVPICRRARRVGEG